uniref:DUF952 domain-containing protein n=1 Tax=Roseihalotalea indica TaxID=2867963 RepID=A0AA49GRQ9_9BACT|nr:DUF952 domain-containing protein [Tunicatimonas sp. TK19036]
MNDEIPIATCYLHHDEDERNRSWLTNQHFYVKSKGKLKRFDLERIQRLAIEQRRWWFPVVAGGILAPLSLLAILLNLYNPWWLISLLVGSMLLWYWGASQHMVLAIHQHHHRQDISLPAATPNLEAFVQFTNRFLRRSSQHLYIQVEPEAWQRALQTGVYRPMTLQQNGFIPAYSSLHTKNEISSTQQWVMIDPLHLTSPIRYETEGGQLHPRIYGPIPMQALTSINTTEASGQK